MQVILIYRVQSRCLILAKTGKNFLVQMSMDVQSFCAFLNWQLHTGYFKIYIYIYLQCIYLKKSHCSLLSLLYYINVLMCLF